MESWVTGCLDERGKDGIRQLKVKRSENAYYEFSSVYILTDGKRVMITEVRKN